MRVIAFLIVLCTASIAQGALTVTMDPSTTRPGAPNQPIGLLVTIRNPGPGTVTINDITKLGSVNCHSSIAIFRIGNTSLGVTLNPGQFAQYVVISLAGVPEGSWSCTWQIDTGTTIQGFMTTIVAQAANAQPDFQPHALQMGAPLVASETQQIRVFNHTAAPITVTLDLSWMTSPTNLKFDASTPGCGGTDLCSNVPIGANQAFTAYVVCNPGMSGSVNGIAHMTPSSGPGQDITWSCNGTGATTDGNINIVEPSIDLMGTSGTPISLPANIEGAGNTFTYGMIDGGDAMAFSFTDTAICGFSNPRICDRSANPISLATPLTLHVQCTPDGTDHTSTMFAFGGAGYGGGDVDMAQLSCHTTGGGPTINVSPTLLDAMNVPVGQTKGMMSFDIQNNGGAPLVATILLSDPNWTASDCMTSQCTIAPGATNKKTIDVTFTPSAFGPDNATLTVDSNAGMPTVSLRGVGVGEELIVTTPNPNNRIDFGTIGKNQLVERTVTLSSSGNDPAGLAVQIGAMDAPAAPFATSTSSVQLGQVDSGSFKVSCQAPSPGGPFQDDISVSSTAYKTNGVLTNNLSMTAKCTVANTVVQVMPSTLDFGEVRKMAGGVRTIDVMIFNPGAPVNLSSVKLSKSIPGLSLVAPATGTLDTNDSRIATIKLATDEDTVLADVALEIHVDADLAFPITGKVVTPKAFVTPASLDLGTACVGSAVSGAVMLVNDGTATLHVQPPEMDSSFTPLFVAPTTYPADGSGAPLAPMDSAIAGVTPSASAVGMIGGNLTWKLDSPESPFTVPVTLEYIDQGAALSPKLLGFGLIDVGATSTQQKITIENCNATPIIAAVVDMKSIKGGIDAWEVQPFRTEKPLGRHDSLEIFVRFAPKRPGMYVARLELRLDGETRFVDINGEASGVVVDPKSLYACDCNTNGEQSIFFAGLVLLVICRRRTGSS